MCALLRGEDGAAQSGARTVFPLAADRIFRGHRQRTGDSVAGSGFAGAAELSGGRTERDATRSLDDFADAAVDRCGNASSGIRLGTGVAGGEGSFKGEDDRHRWYDVRGQRGDALHRAAGNGDGYQEFLTRLAKDSGIATPTREQLAKLDRKRARKGSNEDWVNPHDPEAHITKMKDGRTHLAYKAEHAVDLETGAVVAVTVAAGDAGDTATILETLPQAGEHIAQVACATNDEKVGERVHPEGPVEAVGDKGYHSNDTLTALADGEVRSYISEPDRGQR